MILPAIPLVLWLLLLLVFPHVRLIIMSFMKLGQDSLREGGVYFGNYVVTLTEPSMLFLRVFLRTGLFSLLNTLVTLLVAYPIAFYIAKKLRGPRKYAMLILIALPFYISELIRVYAWMTLLRESGFVNYILVDVLHVMDQPVEFLYTDGSLLLVFAYSSMLLMLMPIYSILEGLPNEQLEAAQDLGAGPLSTLRHIVIPTSLPGVTAGCILVFMFSAGSYLIPNLVGGKDSLWATEMIYNRFVGSTNWNLGSAYSLMLLLMTSAMVLVALRLTGQSLRGVLSEQ
jgi:spermidine/putrescine transport system permease protein